jgi:hypothetical protein
MSRVEHDDKCKLYCTDNEKTVTAEVMHFRPQDGLTVVLAESKIVMKYNKQHDIYIGGLMGMEFTTKGPKYYEVNDFRRTR